MKNKKRYSSSQANPYNCNSDTCTGTTIDTLITNPGIADRIGQDVKGFFEYGYSFERCSSSSSEDDKNNDNENNMIYGILRSSRFTPVTTINRFMEENILSSYHLWIDIPSPTLVSSVGPFLRTLVRITEGVDPHSLKVVIHFQWEEQEVEKDTTTSISNKNNHHKVITATKIAHHIHMLVRNSMGAALFLSKLWIQLPRNVSVTQIREVMRDNINVNYPSIGLVEKENNNYNEEVCVVAKSSSECKKEVRCVPPISVGDHLVYKDGSVSCRIQVLTRMCTVRFTPILYHLSRALRNENNTILTEVIQIQTIPLILVCVDKPANLFRIIMLVRDYNMIDRLVIIVRNENTRNRLATETRKFMKDLKNDHQDYDTMSIPRVLTIDDTCILLNSECDHGVIAVDLHVDALTLDEEESTIEGKSAVDALRNSEAVIWGFESDGIPSKIDALATKYVQIRTRTSLNLAAAISIVLHRGWSGVIK